MKTRQKLEELKQNVLDAIPHLRNIDTPMTTENLTTILNKLLAMHAAKIVTVKQIAKAIGSSEQRVGEWIIRNGQRDRRPNGEMAIRLLAFASDQTLKIATSRRLQVAYRSAYRDIAERFPVKGKD